MDGRAHSNRIEPIELKRGIGMFRKAREIKGEVEYLLGWLIGIPIPILIIIYLVRGH